MGFSVVIESGETIGNEHPDPNIHTKGKAVFAFLSILIHYDMWKEDPSFDIDQSILEWFQNVQKYYPQQIHEVCQPLVKCMWGNGGDFTQYRENEWEWYLKRTGQTKEKLPEEMFKQMLRHAEDAYQPIPDVIAGIKLLLEIFTHPETKVVDWFFEPPSTNTDFEALLANLEWLANRGNDKVRLTFI